VACPSSNWLVRRYPDLESIRGRADRHKAEEEHCRVLIYVFDAGGIKGSLRHTSLCDLLYYLMSRVCPPDCAGMHIR
jgi:hypothetical protein